MCKATLKTKLLDADSSFDHRLPIKIMTDERGVTIAAEGHGDYGSEDGNGSPLFLELHQGSLRLLVWADINTEEPTHIIDLSGAREDRRNETKHPLEQ